MYICIHACACTHIHVHTYIQIDKHALIYFHGKYIFCYSMTGAGDDEHFSLFSFFFSHYLQKQVTWKCATKLDRYGRYMVYFYTNQHNHIMHTFVCFKWKRRKTEVQGRNEIPRNLRMLFQILKLVYYVALGIFINFLISLHDSSNIKWNQILDTC